MKGDRRETQKNNESNAENPDRRGFLKSGLGVGGAALVGVGAAGLLASTTLTRPVEATHGAVNSDNIVINNPASSSQSHNRILPTDDSTIALQIKRKSGATADLFQVLKEDETQQWLRVNSSGDLFVWNGFAALRVHNTDGFREMHFRDGSTGFGRLAFLVADRIELGQSHFVEDFWGSNFVPTLWESSLSGGGTPAILTFQDKANGVFLARTGAKTNNRALIATTRRNHQMNFSIHAQFGLESLTGGTQVYIVVGFCDSSVSQVTDLANFNVDGQNPQNAFWVEYDAGASAVNWKARHKTGGLVQGTLLDTAIGFLTGRQWWRFEFWPANEAGKDYDRVEIFHSSVSSSPGSPAIVELVANLPGGVPVRPFIGIKTKNATDKQIEVDYVFAYQGH